MIEKKFIQLSKPSLRDQASDLERILAQVGKNKKVAFSLLGGLPEIVRKADFEVTAVLVEDELIAVEPGDTHALRSTSSICFPAKCWMQTVRPTRSVCSEPTC